MKILEVINVDNFNAEEYDVAEDLIFFMNNDPMFYRQNYYPSMLKFMDCNKSGKPFESSSLRPMVKKAYEMYFHRFPVKNLQKEIDSELLDGVCSKIYETELENIKTGHYTSRK
jgi:hypothetical protein